MIKKLILKIYDLWRIFSMAEQKIGTKTNPSPNKQAKINIKVINIVIIRANIAILNFVRYHYNSRKFIMYDVSKGGDKDQP